MTYTVVLTREARDDLLRLEDFLVEVALEQSDFDLPRRAVQANRHEMRVLETNPYTCRKVSGNPRERGSTIPFGRSGHVALFEIFSDEEVVVPALRHQREDDYH